MINVQELSPPEPKEEDPFEGVEAEATEPAAVVKEEPEGEETEGGEAAAEDTEMADAEPKQAEDDAEVVELLEEEAVHMPASQDDPGTCPSFPACKLHTQTGVPLKCNLTERWCVAIGLSVKILALDTNLCCLGDIGCHLRPAAGQSSLDAGKLLCLQEVSFMQWPPI